jgi:hypothetical protein
MEEEDIRDESRGFQKADRRERWAQMDDQTERADIQSGCSRLTLVGVGDYEIMGSQ